MKHPNIGRRLVRINSLLAMAVAAWTPAFGQNQGPVFDLVARNSAAKNDFSAGVSSGIRSFNKKDYDFIFSVQEPAGGGVSVGVGGGIREGKTLETMLWASAGAVAGSLAGPLGAAIGGGVGALTGFFIGAFVVPKNGPGAASTR